MIQHCFTIDINNLIVTVSDSIWNYFLIFVLIIAAIYFTIRTAGVQFRLFPQMCKGLVERRKDPTQKHKSVSTFQAFAVSIATRVGTGNLAGVATAIAMGGPGAVFWMWLIALLGSATAFVESTLGQLFKERSSKAFIGGPAYYIKRGLKNKTLAIIFAVVMTITFGLTYNSIQSNTICEAMNTAFGFNKTIIGIILTVLSLVVVFGGIHRIAKVSSIIVPVMAIGYLILALYVILNHINLIPQVFSIIFADAFGADKVAAGGIGATMMWGLKRGLFSNEAGEGSAPHAAATATTTHPVKQGLVQALGVFTDTLLVCSCTAFIILFSGVYEGSDLNGISLTQAALEHEIGRAGVYYIAIAIFLFAYSSILGNFYYGEANIRFITKKKVYLQLFRILSGGVFVIFGAIASLTTVWNLGDICMALITVINIYSIFRLGKYAFRLLKDYSRQKKEGKDPVFHRSQLPDIEDRIECWE